MTEPLLSELGYCVHGSQVANILNGTYEPSPRTDHYAGLLFKEMAMPATVRNGPKASTNVTMAEHQSGWRKQKETTSAEPHGLTFSHYKGPCRTSMDFRQLFGKTSWMSKSSRKKVSMTLRRCAR
jgi:hypothetical protein